MIGIVIATHGQLGEVFIETAELIFGSRPDAMIAVSVNLKEDADRLRNKIAKGIKAVNRKEGVLVFTDMFGGTPSNISYSFLDEGRVEVLSGVNLPMLLKALDKRSRMDIGELSLCLEEFGRQSISLASAILKGKTKN